MRIARLQFLECFQHALRAGFIWLLDCAGDIQMHGRRLIQAAQRCFSGEQRWATCFALVGMVALAEAFPRVRLVESRTRFDVWSDALTLVIKTISLAGVQVASLRRWGDRIVVTTASGETEILLTEDEPMRGVARLWFQCPGCRKRCRHIYLPELQCRSCLALEAAQHDDQWTNISRVRWLRRRRGELQRRRARSWQLSEQLAREEATLAVNLGRFITKAAKGVRGG